MTKNTRTPSIAPKDEALEEATGQPRVPARWPRITSATDNARSPSRLRIRIPLPFMVPSARAESGIGPSRRQRPAARDLRSRQVSDSRAALSRMVNHHGRLDRTFAALVDPTRRAILELRVHRPQQVNVSGPAARRLFLFARRLPADGLPSTVPAHEREI